MAQILMIAGNETTRSLFAGAGQAMAEHPDQRHLLAASPDLVPPAVEEFLRYVTPVTHMCRTALDDVELRGQQIRRGDYLCLLYAAANRDEESGIGPTSSTSPATPEPAHARVRLRRALLSRREPGPPGIADRADRAAGPVPQLRARRRHRPHPPAHDAGHQDHAGDLPPLTVTHRVVQWTTGKIGEEAGRGIVAHPELDLVGCFAFSPDKVGRDVGELCGLDPIGIAATDDVEAFLALAPDCVSYMPYRRASRRRGGSAG